MENIKLMNICKIIDKKNNKVLVQERVKSWTGIAFPGGKINSGESIVKSTIREVKEETGLNVSKLKLCGIKNWYNSDKNERSIVFLYETSTFDGDLIDKTDEGKNYWISEKKINIDNASPNFKIMLNLFSNDDNTEMIYDETMNDWIIQ